MKFGLIFWLLWFSNSHYTIGKTDNNFYANYHSKGLETKP